jgi:hypothetical protein
MRNDQVIPGKTAPSKLSVMPGYQPLAFMIGIAAPEVKNVMSSLLASGSLAAALRPAVNST